MYACNTTKDCNDQNCLNSKLPVNMQSATTTILGRPQDMHDMLGKDRRQNHLQLYRILSHNTTQPDDINQPTNHSTNQSTN